MEHQKLTILLVDDDNIERSGVRFLIERAQLPLHILEAPNGQRALEIIRQEAVDILFTDVKMPYMDGLELSAILCQEFPQIKIIIFSAYGEFEYAKKAMAAKAINYLLKPIDVAEFEGVMDAVIRYCQEERTLVQQNAPRLPADSSQPSTSDPEVSHVVQKVKRLIAERYSEDLSLDCLGQSVGLAPSYLSYVFKRETGENLIKYLTDYRMGKAKEMLDEGTLKIVQVAKLCGYDNPSYFNRLFKNTYGLTPSQYKEKANGHS